MLGFLQCFSSSTIFIRYFILFKRKVSSLHEETRKNFYVKYILLNVTTTGFKYVNYCSFLYAIFTSSDKQEPEISIGTIKTKKNVFPMANVLPCVNLMFHVGDKKKRETLVEI